MKSTKGITLVALVITIIILLILAGITIGTVLGQNGLFQRAKQAGEKYKEAEKSESDQLEDAEREMDKIISGESINSTIKVKGIDKTNDSVVKNWKFSICKDKECLEPLAIDVQVGENGEADCSSIIKNTGKYYFGVTEPPEGQSLPFKLFEFDITNQKEQELVIEFYGAELESSHRGVWETSIPSTTETPNINTQYENNMLFNFDVLEELYINKVNYSSEGIDFYPSIGLDLLSSDIRESDMIIDFYKVGEWDEDKKAISINNNFKDLNNVNTSNLNRGFSYDPVLTTRIKNIIRKTNLAPTGSLQFGEAETSVLNTGIEIKKKDCYFVLPHGADSEEIGKAHTDYYDISFIPAIFSFPYYGNDEQAFYDLGVISLGCVNISNIFSNLEIINDVTNETNRNFETQNFMFEIIGRVNGDIAYDDIAMMTCKNAERNSSIISIPTGMEYTVLEKFGGSRCELSSYESEAGMLAAGEQITAYFQYNYTSKINNSSAMTSRIRYNSQKMQWEIESQNKNGITNKINIIDVNNTYDDVRDELKKSVKIQNTDSEDKWVRVKLICPEYIHPVISGDDWTQGDEEYCYYYNNIIHANDSTGDITFTFSSIDSSIYQSCYNVGIIVETTKVWTDEGSDENYAIWDYSEDSGY